LEIRARQSGSLHAEATTGPMVVVADTESIELVSVIRGAIALVDAGD
jgi:hypothetical protein